MEHDHSYKLLFSHPRMVADLLQGFVQEPWVTELDLTTLERVSGSHVSDDLREREDDVIWRVRWRGEWLYVYLLLEFQSTVDRFMAVRLLVYIGLLYQQLIRSRQLTPAGTLPPVVPVVLYNGQAPWTAPQTLEALIADIPGGLAGYRPRLQYLLLDEGRYTEQELAPLRNLAAVLFRLEHSRDPAAVQRVLQALIAWVSAPEDDSLRRAFTVWLRRVLLPARVPGVAIPEVQDLMEVQTMLAERVQEWTRQWKEEGLREGRQEGRQEGLQTARDMLLEVITTRFGTVSADVAAAVQRLETRDALRMLLRQAMTCPTLEALRDALHAPQP